MTDIVAIKIIRKTMKLSKENIPTTLIHHFLEESAAHLPDKIAVINDDVRATYSEINSKANQLARWFVSHGIKDGDRIVILLPNSLEYIVSYYGILKAGNVAVSLSTALKPSGLISLLQEIEPKVIISSSRFEKLLQLAELENSTIDVLFLKNPSLPWSASQFTTIDWDEFFRADDEKNPIVDVPETSLASIVYTSGSTGEPKGVMLSHRNIVSNTYSICRYLELRENDIQMVVLPFYYVMGKSLLNTHFAVGGTVVLNNKFAFPASVLNQMVEEKVTGFSGVPSTYAYLLHRSPLAKYRDRLEHLRYCSQAGGHMSRVIKMELHDVIPPHTKIYIMYGATEASARLSYLEPAKFSEKIDSIGKAIPGVTLKVMDSDDSEMPPGKVGELVASGPNIMSGYWKDPEATAQVITKAGYRTGDMAYKDEDGYFYVIGREDNMVKVVGHRINPIEIEDTMMESGLLTETIVMGIPDQLMGHKLAALATVKDPSSSEQDLLKYCAGKLPRYKMPGSIKLIKNIPKNENGKIDRTRCLELLTK